MRAPRWPAVTFRGRLVLATTAAVLVVVILGSIATYLVAYNSLIGSVDVNLEAWPNRRCPAQPAPRRSSTAAAIRAPALRWSYLHGGDQPRGPRRTAGVATGGPGRPPVEGQDANAFFSTTVGGLDVREMVVALPAGYVYSGSNN